MVKNYRDSDNSFLAIMEYLRLTDAKSGKPLYTISKAETDVLANAGFACEDADFVVF